MEFAKDFLWAFLMSDFRCRYKILDSRALHPNLKSYFVRIISEIKFLSFATRQSITLTYKRLFETVLS